MFFRSSSLICLSLLLAVAGCAVTPGDINARVERSQADLAASTQQLQSQRQAEPALVRIRGNYVGGVPVELGYKLKLPAAFRDVTLRFPDAPSLRIMAERITEVTRLPVEIHHDALSTAAASNSANTPAANTTPSLNIAMDFRGNLADYLDLVCARLGLGWDYVNGTINISRYVTRTYQLAASPGTISYGTKVSKGSQASTGVTGSSNSQATGSFSGSSETGVEAGKLSPIDALKSSITGMLSQGGRININEATGTIVVTDTRMVVEQVGKLIEHENQLLTKQMALQVDMLTLQLDDNSQAEIDVNVVYKALSGHWQASTTAAGSLATANASSLSYNVFSGTPNGSTVVAKALNSVGRVVQNTSTTLITTNRVPIPLASFSTKGYLASTNAASGGGTSGGVGVPGLTPGSVTTGLFLSALPTILDNNGLLLRLSIDSSTLQSIEATSTGRGDTFQQIQYPNITGYKSDHNVTLRAGDSLVLVGLNAAQTQGQQQSGILSMGMNNRNAQTMQVIVVTPRIQSGI